MTTADDFSSRTINNHERPLAESIVLPDYLKDADPTPALFSASNCGRAQPRLVSRIVDFYMTSHTRNLPSNMNSGAHEVHDFTTLRSQTSI